MTFSDEPENEDEGNEEGESAKGNADNKANIVRRAVGRIVRPAKVYMSIFLQKKVVMEICYSPTTPSGIASSRWTPWC